ncbi:hypothetical protein ACQKLX_11000 [Bosea sp. NPDC003192]|jgi:hypothetical protein|uniref:hypothetical protein n=1 Tax=Bosea sp. NPDC003192 TaxID=3390551 RepID=UPI003D058105
MMFNLFEVLADRVREQAAEYANAQARIGLRTVAGVFDPFGLMAAMTVTSSAILPTVGTELRPPRLKSERRIRRSGSPADKQRPRQTRRPALNFA